jgi:arginine decarboxylase
MSILFVSFSFSLSVSQIARRLTEAGLLDSLQLLHFHIGSQISNISVIKNALREAGQFYAQLAKLGANMQYMVWAVVMH